MKRTSLATWCHYFALAPLLGSAVRAAYNCETLYGHQSVKSIPTHSTKFTSTDATFTYRTSYGPSTTDALVTVHANTTVTHHVTRVTTVAPTTTTVPTSADFTPVASAKAKPQSTGSATSKARRKKRRLERSRRTRNNVIPARAVEAPNSYIYPTAVTCQSIVYDHTSTETFTEYDPYGHTTTTKGAPTTTIYHRFHASTTITSTIHTSLATLYQACTMASNMIDTFHGYDIIGCQTHGGGNDIVIGESGVTFSDSYNGSPSVGQHSGDQGALVSPRNCCHAAFDQGCVGWEFFYGHDSYGDVLRFCHCLPKLPGQAGTWSFETSGYGQPQTYCGNGPQGIPYFAGEIIREE